jgi:hypothetical protein
VLLRVVIAIFAVFTSCSTRRVPVPARVSASHPEYIDLEAGWRLRVVTPISKRGNYRLNYKDVKQADGTITLTTDEFRGYETAYYSVEARKGGGVQIRFVSAELSQDGKSAILSESVRPQFETTQKFRLVRLVYLTRVSDSDHDMAVVAANKQVDLEASTKAVLAEAVRGCVTRSQSQCSWIPAGVAVRPEKQQASR